jgi:hypothetical protein
MPEATKALENQPLVFMNPTNTQTRNVLIDKQARQKQHVKKALRISVSQVRLVLDAFKEKPPGTPSTQIAIACGVNRSMVDYIRRLTARPDLLERILSGELSIHEADRIRLGRVVEMAFLIDWRRSDQETLSDFAAWLKEHRPKLARP